MKEADSLAYCKRLGYHWDGLYDVFDRVSCFCCPKAGKAKRRLLREHFPDLEREWQRLDAVACMSNNEATPNVASATSNVASATPDVALQSPRRSRAP